MKKVRFIIKSGLEKLSVNPYYGFMTIKDTKHWFELCGTDRENIFDYLQDKQAPDTFDYFMNYICNYFNNLGIKYTKIIYK